MIKTLEGRGRQSVIGYGNRLRNIYRALKHLTCYDASTRRTMFFLTCEVA